MPRGKDSVIKHVMSGVIPQDCQVFSLSIQARSNSNTIFSGVPLVIYRKGGGSASLTVLITKKC